MEDNSLFMPWQDEVMVTKELNSIESINNKNLEKFRELQDSVKTSPLFHQLSLILSPGEKDQRHKKHMYFKQKNKVLKEVENYKVQHGVLTEDITQITSEIKDLKDKLKQCSDNTNLLQKQVEKNEEERRALNLAKGVYDTNLGMNIVTESESEDIFKATVSFSKEKSIVLRIHRKTNKILDFHSNSLPEKLIKKLENEFRQTNDPKTLVCTFRDLCMN